VVGRRKTSAEEGRREKVATPTSASPAKTIFDGWEGVLTPKGQATLPE